MSRFIEKGRSILEMIAVMTLAMFLAISGTWGFKKASLSSQVNTMTKDIATAVTERRYNIARGGIKENTRTTKVGNTPMTITNRVVNQDFFITIPMTSDDLCEEMKGFNVFSPKYIGGQNAGGNIPLTENATEMDCTGIIALSLYFDGYDNEQSGSGTGLGGGSSTGSVSVLANPCDGITCGLCEKCVDGSCVPDAAKAGRTFGCGHCHANGSVTKDLSTVNECTTCNESTWQLVYKTNTAPCGTCQRCNGAGTCVSTGTECGVECCPNGCNSTGDGCKKECPTECDSSQFCDTDVGECRDKCPSGAEYCNGVCCGTNETCEEGVCKELRGWFEDTTCADPETPFRTSDGQCVQCVKDSHCAANPENKFCDRSTHTCVQCTKDRHCGSFYDYDDERGCRNNVCVYTPCNIGSCQTCSVTKIDWDTQNKVWKPTVRHGFAPKDTDCEQSGVQGKCDSQGHCKPNGTRCNSVTGCPSGQFCHFYGGDFSSTLPFVCEKVQPMTFTVTDEKGQSVTYYYPRRDDLRSWCRGGDGDPGNCAWGYLSYDGAQSWCYGIGKRLLTSAEFKEIITASDHLLKLELLDVFSKEYSDLDELNTFIQETQEKIKTLEDTEANLNSLTQKNNLLDELTSDCENLSCLNSKLTDVLSLIKGYTDFESLQKHTAVLKRYIQLHRNISKPQRWNGKSYTSEDTLNTSIWVQGGVYVEGSLSVYSNRNDGYWGAGSVICR